MSYHLRLRLFNFTALNQSSDVAETDLGVMYDMGQGVPQNYAEALKWYRKAAEQSHADAEYNLTVIYRHGKGIQQNYPEALKWFQLAAEQGNADAQYNLGM